MADVTPAPRGSEIVLGAVVVLALAGTLFASYLTYYTLTSGRLACELFILGMPSCFYGMMMFAVVFVLSLYLAVWSLRDAECAALAAVSAFGVCFSGYLTYLIFTASSCSGLAIFGVPPCAYGLTMYLLLLALSGLELFIRYFRK